jgi:microcystin-dependent protein
MANPYLGEIRIFGFNFAPLGWALCNGQLLPIQQYVPLFSLIGTYYGGDGVRTFQLPNLQGRMAIHQGAGAGLPTFVIGEEGGTTNATITTENLPSHSHSVTAEGANGVQSSPSGAFIAGSGAVNLPVLPNGPFAPSTTSPVNMAASMIGQTGGNRPFSIQNPYLVMSFCIALEGVFPSRS